MKPKLVNIYKFHLCATLLRRRESNPGLSALCPTTLSNPQNACPKFGVFPPTKNRGPMIQLLGLYICVSALVETSASVLSRLPHMSVLKCWQPSVCEISWARQAVGHLWQIRENIPELFWQVRPSYCRPDYGLSGLNVWHWNSSFCTSLPRLTGNAT